MQMEPLLLLPEILLFAGGLACLLAGSFLPRERQWVARILTILALLGTIVATVIGPGAEQTIFGGTYALDVATQATRVIASVATLLIVLAAANEIAGTARESETYALMLFSTTGAVVVAGANDLLLLAVGFLLASIPLYGLIGFQQSARSAEGAMKTYLIGALFGILLLFGVTILYGVAGTSVYSDLTLALGGMPNGVVVVGAAAVLAGLMFKAGAVPAHFWVPDSAQAASGLVATFLTTVPKIGALVATYRLAVSLPENSGVLLLVGILAVLTMTLGNLAAYWQDDPRRLLGWSTVGQAGFLLVPAAVAAQTDLALPALLLYLLAYAVTNVAAFAVTVALPELRSLEKYRALAAARPWLAAALVVALLGLVGTPPTAVFVGKLTVATAAWDGGLAWLAVALLLNTLLSLYYYLRWIIPMYRSPTLETGQSHKAAPNIWASAVALVAASATVFIGLFAGLLLPLFTGTLAP